MDCCGIAWRVIADAFRLLQKAGLVPAGLADRLVRAAGFRNIVVHAYEADMQRVHEAARNGPADLRSFLASMRDCADRAAEHEQP